MNSVVFRNSLADQISSLKKVYSEKGYFRPAYGRACAHALSLALLLLTALWLVSLAKIGLVLVLAFRIFATIHNWVLIHESNRARAFFANR